MAPSTHRFSTIAIVTALLLGSYGHFTPNAIADEVNPIPSSVLCADGRPRLTWPYSPTEGLPDNAETFDCGFEQPCYAMPESACLDMVEKSTPGRSADVPSVLKAPDPPRAQLPPRHDNPFTPQDAQPSHPTGLTFTDLPAPDQECEPGDGWDFEKVGSHLPTLAELDGWKGSTNSGSPFADIQNQDLDLRAAPVYGNAVPIDRILPPGWLPNMMQKIGGDYWMYSQSINQHGNFWISSRYRRYSWGQHPGAMWDESSTGTLESRECRLRARYLTFRLSGGASTSQRIEVDVRGAEPRHYFGIRFSGSLGDQSLGGTYGHGTQFPGVAASTQTFPPLLDPDWTAVRTVTSENAKETEWMQSYVFDLQPFEGRIMKIRIVDDNRSECGRFENGQCVEYRPAHVNADAFRFSDTIPKGVTWFEYDERRCGEVEGAGDGCSPVGVFPSQPPLWGITDVHAHPMANLAFGGHVMWGDVTDKLQDIYDCSHKLKKIAGAGGRDEIDPGVVESSCYVAGDVVVIATAVQLAGCTALTVVPFVGAGAAFLCKSIVSAAQIALLTTPIIQGLTLHGGDKFAGGAFNLGFFFSKSISLTLQAIGAFIDDPATFSPGLMPSVDSWDNAKPTIEWYPKDKKWHSWTGLGKTHNHYQADMIKRAYEGGLRLGVWDVVNSRAFALIADGNSNAPDWQALKDQTDAAKRILNTSLSSIAAIAYTPAEARAIITGGKMAVILGSEVDELGRMRPEDLPWPRSPHSGPDSMQKQIDDLWELGIRKVTPVHAVNNPVGGAAIFTKDYVANNHFLNATPLDDEPGFFSHPAVRFVFDRSIAGKLIKIVLGKFSVLKKIGGDGKTPWNPEGWFEFDDSLLLDPYIGSTDQVTYRVGEDDPKPTGNPATKRLRGDNGEWLAPSEILNEQILIPQSLNDLSTFIRPFGRCDLHNTVYPDHAQSFGSTVDTQFTAVDGHRNKAGIYTSTGNDGVAFLRALMKKGMLLDVDHLSQKMRLQLYILGGAYAREAGWESIEDCEPEQKCGDYPVMGVHSTVRELEKEGSELPHLISQFGSNNESTRTPKELSHVAKNRGVVGVFPRPVIIPPNTEFGRCTRNTDCTTWNGDDFAACVSGKCVGNSPLTPRDFELPAEVRNDCDGSSKTFAVKYLWLMRQMGGWGLTFTTDFNGLNSLQNPRFGRSIPGSEACGSSARAKSLRDGRDWGFIMKEWQKIEHSGVWYDDYASKSPKVSDLAALWADSDQQLPKKRWKEVVARNEGDVREDRAPRYTVYSDGSNVRDKVYYNDFGPDVAYHDWKDQDGNRPGAQLYPLKRWQNFFDGWDFNLDGFQHIGLLPDLMQDLRNVGVQWEQIEPLFHGSEDFLYSWQRAVDIGSDHP